MIRYPSCTEYCLKSSTVSASFKTDRVKDRFAGAAARSNISRAQSRWLDYLRWHQHSRVECKIQTSMHCTYGHLWGSLSVNMDAPRMRCITSIPMHRRYSPPVVNTDVVVQHDHVVSLARTPPFSYFPLILPGSGLGAASLRLFAISWAHTWGRTSCRFGTDLGFA